MGQKIAQVLKGAAGMGTIEVQESDRLASYDYLPVVEIAVNESGRFSSLGYGAREFLRESVDLFL